LSAPIYICDIEAIENGGAGLRFPIMLHGADASAFVIRYAGQAHAYVNRCVHVPMELDWNLGQFFDGERRYLMCSTHGALYEPDSGRCAGGPCRGGKLQKLQLIEMNEKIYWEPDADTRPAIA
jgi:nitrite reductase/ring-hydroxylating ferredoxin subunit